MRSLSLYRIAAEAEGLRLRRMSQRTVTRVAVGAVAMVFLTAALIFAHLVVWFWLRTMFSELVAAAIIGGGDLVLGLILVLFAAVSSPGRVEREALQVRRQALAGAGSVLAPMALATVAVPALRLGAELMRSRR
jgi:hypothetical protein